jgi:hypothetical protein
VTDVYLSTGHGRTRDGRYDPGTQGGGKVEHEEASRVVGLAAAALRRSGVAVEHDQCPDPISGYAHAPNFYGSAARSRALRPLVSVEAHFDWAGAPRGGFGIHDDDPAGLALADAIRARYRAAGLPIRAHQDRRLYFVAHGYGPLGCILWECDRIGAASPVELGRMAEALAAGICDRLGVRYVPAGAPPPRSAPRLSEEDKMARVLVKGKKAPWWAYHEDRHDKVHVPDRATAASLVEAGRWLAQSDGTPYAVDQAWLEQVPRADQ